MRKIIGFIVSLIFKKENGTFCLGYGKHKGYLIKLRSTPKKFFFSIKEKEETGCCNSVVSAYNYKIVKNGIMFHANVKSNNVKIDWIAKY